MFALQYDTEYSYVFPSTRDNHQGIKPKQYWDWLDSLIIVPCGSKTGRNVQYDIAIRISKQRLCAFCWFSVVK